MVVTGVIGAETLGERYAQERGFGVKQFLADWKLNGRGAKQIRKTQMIEAADHAVFLKGGKNKVVVELIEKAEAKASRWRSSDSGSCKSLVAASTSASQSLD